MAGLIGAAAFICLAICIECPLVGFGAVFALVIAGMACMYG